MGKGSLQVQQNITLVINVQVQGKHEQVALSTCKLLSKKKKKQGIQIIVILRAVKQLFIIRLQMKNRKRTWTG